MQRKIIGPLPAKRQQSVERSKRRSIPAETDLIPIYNAGKRVGPQMIFSQDRDTAAVVESATLKNISWVLARLSNAHCQTISSWTGFNIEIRDNIVVTQDTVAYLPTVNAPATELSTVHEVLNRTLQIMESLQLSNIVCVLTRHYMQKRWKLHGNTKTNLAVSFSEWAFFILCAHCWPF